VRVVDGAVCVRTRPGRECTDEFPEVAAIADALEGRSVILDGELVCLDSDGHPNFAAIRGWLLRRRGGPRAKPPVCFMAFDLLFLDGEKVWTLPYSERRARLDSLELDGQSSRAPRHFVGDEAAGLAGATAERGLEGVIYKRLDAPYEPGRRAHTWLKLKNRTAREYAVSGWLPGEPGCEPDRYYLAQPLPEGRPAARRHGDVRAVAGRAPAAARGRRGA